MSSAWLSSSWLTDTSQARLVHLTNGAHGESTYARLIDRNDIDKLVAETNSSLSLEKAIEMLYLPT
jgi:hypothetical protein